jgi:hypothetical protein
MLRQQIIALDLDYTLNDLGLEALDCVLNTVIGGNRSKGWKEQYPCG